MTSKNELKHPEGSFLPPHCLLQLLTGYFIHLSIQPTTFPLQEQSKTESTNLPAHQWDCQDSTHILNSLISHPISNKLFNRISKITFSKTKIKPRSRGTFTIQSGSNQSVLQYHKILKSILRGIHKISSMTRFSNFLDPSLGGDLHKTWYGFNQYPKYRSHSRETSQNTSNFHNFSKYRTRPTDLTTNPKVYEHSPDNIIDAPKSSQISD